MYVEYSKPKGEPLLAHLALMWLFPSVNIFMLKQMGLLVELFITKVARVFEISCVDSFVMIDMAYLCHIR